MEQRISNIKPQRAVNLTCFILTGLIYFLPRANSTLLVNTEDSKPTIYTGENINKQMWHQSLGKILFPLNYPQCF